MTRYIGLDIETASLEARTNPDILLYCVCTAEIVNEQVVYCTFTAEEFRSYQETADDDIIYVIHNAVFDVACLMVRGIVIQPGKYICSQLMGYCANTHEKVGLDHVASTYLNRNKVPLESVLTERGILPKEVKVFDFDYSSNDEALVILINYCQVDAELALRWFYYCWENYYTDDQRLLTAFFDLEMPYIECIIEMQSTGMYVDVDKLSDLNEVLVNEITTTQLLINNEVGLLPEKCSWSSIEKKYIPEEKVFSKKADWYQKKQPIVDKVGCNNSKSNIASYYTHDGVIISSNPTYVYNHCKISQLNPESNQLGWYLMNRGWKPSPKGINSKSGEPCLDRKVIAKIIDKYEFLKHTKYLNEVSKLKGSFVDKLHTIATSGIEPFVRCNYNQCRTVTTRLSSDSPNLQQVPARTKLGKKIRETVIAPPGYDLWVADLDSIELKVLAYYLSQVVDEHRMRDSILDGVDLHQANADAWGLDRQTAKKIFSVIYGGQAAAVGAYGNDGTPEEGQVILDAMKNGMPKIWELMVVVWSTARKRDGVLYTLMGSKLHYPELMSSVKWKRAEAERQSFNAVIQGTAANINKELTLSIMDTVRGCGGRLAFTVHDENGVYVPRENRDKFYTEVSVHYKNTELLRGKDFTIPVTGDWHYGNNWVIAKGG
jgi:DNA polymerase I-like protein with 3'-5' exonuclease and polymerase domains